MSYQHLYSRVPARVSLYNKRDGFDTFAHTAGLNPDFIRGELSPVYFDKLGLFDALKIRRGEIPTVYSQILLPSGVVAQTAVNYMPVDFTGERSAYFAHTLVLDPGERAAVLNSSDTDPFNPAMFFKDISIFNITSPTAAPNPMGPQCRYIPSALANHRETILKYDPDMIKGFIYSILCAICNGGREVFFRLPVDDKDASGEALALMNAIMSVLPFGLRDRLSFVSLVSSTEHYKGFKVKCVCSEVSSVSEESGVFFDFARGTVSGRPSGFEQNALAVSFLYSLFEYGKIRGEFLKFSARISEKYENLRLDINTVRELVFLFWQCSGFYVENTVLPTDESICSLFDIYGRYREGLITEHRVRAYRPLDRYPATHRAIPDGVYSRLCGLYPTECVEAKAVALDTLLKLIHVDLMRDTLFCFISRYYDGEIDSVKAVVNANLCRVFYGGFLQPQIIAFFDAHFRGEPVATQDMILDKLLLSVRTPEIQRQILVFLDRHYAAMTSAQRIRVCNSCTEMLPECDTLCELFVSLINRRIGRDEDDIASIVALKIVDMLTVMLSHGDGRLAHILMQNPGFCEELTTRFVMEKGIGSEILVAILAAMPAHKRGDKLMRMFKMISHLPRQLYLDFLMRFTAIPVVVVPSGLKDMLRLDRLASLSLPADIITPFRERVIYPVIAYTFADVFKAESGEEGLSDLLKYAEKNSVIKAFPHYKLITDYQAMVDKCNRGDTEGAFKLAMAIPTEGELRLNIGEYVRSYNYDPDSQEPETACAYQLVVDYLCKGKFSFGRLYSRYQSYYEENLDDDNIVVKTLIPEDCRAAALAIELIINCASDILGLSSELEKLVLDPSSGLKRAISDFIATLGIAAGPLLKKYTKDSSPEIEELCSELIAERNASISSARDAVDLILRRKN